MELQPVLQRKFTRHGQLTFSQLALQICSIFESCFLSRLPVICWVCILLLVPAFRPRGRLVTFLPEANRDPPEFLLPTPPLLVLLWYSPLPIPGVLPSGVAIRDGCRGRKQNSSLHPLSPPPGWKCRANRLPVPPSLPPRPSPGRWAQGQVGRQAGR